VLKIIQVSIKNFFADIEEVKKGIRENLSKKNGNEYMKRNEEITKIIDFMYNFNLIHIFDKNKKLMYISSGIDVEGINIQNKHLILDKIGSKLQKDEIFHDIAYMNNSMIRVNKELKEIDMKKLMRIYHLYGRIVTEDLEDEEIKKISKEILDNYMDYLITDPENIKLIDKKISTINIDYRFDYNVISYINSYEKLKIYLDNIYLFKNYIFVIINNYEDYLKKKNKDLTIIKEKLMKFDEIRNEYMTKYLLSKLKDVSLAKDKNFKDYESVKKFFMSK